MFQAMSAGLSKGLESPQAVSSGFLKSFWARMLLTIVCAGLIRSAWAPLAHRVPSTRLRVLLVLFVAVFLIWKVWPGLAKAIGNFQARLF
jgi:hypothetical protein